MKLFCAFFSMACLMLGVVFEVTHDSQFAMFLVGCSIAFAVVALVFREDKPKW